MSNPVITKLNKEDSRKLTFSIEHIDRSVINAIRRTLVRDIPVIVLDTSNEHCSIDKNTSRLTNEIIKQRLDCVPLHINDMDFPYDQYTVSLKKQNNENHIQYATSKDFTIVSNLDGKTINEDEIRKIFPKCVKTDMYIDLVRLRPKLTNELNGEEIILDCKLKKTSAKENSSYNVVTKVAFSNTIDINKSKEAWNEYKKTLTDNIEDEEKNWTIHNSQRYFIEDSFDFVLHSIGIYRCTDLMVLACNSLKKDLDMFSSKLKADDITVKQNNTYFKNGYDIHIPFNEITLGYLFQYSILKNHFKKTVGYAGFNKLHPHDNYGILRVQLINDENIINNILLTEVEHLKDILNSIQNNF